MNMMSRRQHVLRVEQESVKESLPTGLLQRSGPHKQCNLVHLKVMCLFSYNLCAICVFSCSL